MGAIQNATEAECQAAFERMRARAPALAKTTAAERLAKLRRIHQAIYDLREEIGRTGLEELGQDGRAQLVPVPAAIADINANLDSWMQLAEIEPTPALMGARGYVKYQPKGVVLHLPSWNAPYLISLSPVLSMIAAGNAVVLKPSEVSPGAAALVAQVIEKAGLSDDVAVVQGGAETAQALLKLPFNHICYVGNNQVGRIIMKAAAENFADVTLEMGGKNPVIVAPDADLEDAASKIVAGRHILAGQGCLCPDYVIAHDSIKDKLAALMVEKVKAFYDPKGEGIRKSPDLARIVNERHTLRIKALIDDAVAKGATVLTGGEVDVADRYISPTILDGITEDMEIFHEEVFGPVLTIHSWSSRGDVVAAMDKRTSALGTYVFSQDRDTVDWFLDNTRSGSGAVNSIASQATVPQLPFGGVNQSGIGQLNGKAGFLEFSNARGIVEDALAPSRPGHYPPSAPGMENIFNMLLAVPPEPSNTLSADSTLEAILADEGGKGVILRKMPELPQHPAFAMIKSMSLKTVQGMSGGQMTDELLAEVDAELKALA
jgi:aldehyde dehydrogenase (NAD+)